jgi:hypothetical protein
VLGGANSCMGPVSFFLGLLAARLGLLDEAVGCLEEATAFAESAGALPGQVLSLEHAAGALSLRQPPGDREKASAYRVRAAAIAERLGVTGMLSRLASASGQWVLRRDGEDWLLEAGAERARLRDSRGLHYLRALLAAPGSEIPALDLVAGGPGWSSWTRRHYWTQRAGKPTATGSDSWTANSQPPTGQGTAWLASGPRRSARR